MSPYVLMSAARNEEDYIEKTLAAVAGQSILPLKWIIVSDGSTDRTDEIVQRYAAVHPFITLLRKPADGERNYGSKAKALKIAYQEFAGLNFEFVGNLDVDVSFAPSYYERCMSKFELNERLGVLGAMRFDLVEGTFQKIRPAQNSAGGPTQFFRRDCYEEIGGYLPLRYGGLDTVAETMARMRGWQVQTFTDLEIFHYRGTGTAGGGQLRARFKSGVISYSVGYHPLFEAARCLFRLFDRPPVIGSLALLTGYFWAWLQRYERQVPEEFVQYLRKEQFTRLRAQFLHSPSHSARV